MGGEPQQGRFDRSALDGATSEIARSAEEELRGLLATEVSVTAPAVVALSAADVAESNDPIVIVLSQTTQEPPQLIQIVLPRSTAAALAGMQLGSAPEEVDEARKEGLGSEMLGAVRGVMKTLVSTIPRCLGSEELRIEIRDALEVDEPASDPTWLDGSDFHRLRLAPSIGEAHPSTIDFLFPAACPPEEEEEEAPTDPRRMLLVSDAPDLVEVDSCQLPDGWVLEPISAEDVAQPEPDREAVDAIVVPWQLDGSNGLELVERLVAAGSGPALIVWHPAPTRSMVMAALQAGAASFVIDLDEIDVALARAERGEA